LHIIEEGGEIIGLIEADPATFGVNTLDVSINSLVATDDTRSAVIDVSLFDYLGTEVQPNGDVKICLKEPEAGFSQDSECLGFFNEDKNRWECADRCLDQQNGLVCGTTSHFTRFSVILDPTGSASGGSGCDSSLEWNGITSIQWVDYVIIISVFCFVCLLAITFVIVVSTCFPGFHGEEHLRVQSLRSMSSGATTTYLIPE